MLKFFNVLLGFLVAQTLVAFLNKYEFISLLGHTLFMPCVVIIYGIYRKWQCSPIDFLIYFAFVLGSIGDAVIFFKLGELGEFIQIAITTVIHIIFIVIFRQEGSRAFGVKSLDLIKIFVPALLIFLFFGFFLLNTVPDSIYFILVFYAILESILLILAYFRPVDLRSFWWVAFGVTSIFLSNIAYSFYFFIKNDQYIYVIMYISNCLGYYFTCMGIAFNQNDKNQSFQKLSKSAIINSIKTIFQIKEKGTSTPRFFEFNGIF